MCTNGWHLGHALICPPSTCPPLGRSPLTRQQGIQGQHRLHGKATGKNYLTCCTSMLLPCIWRAITPSFSLVCCDLKATLQWFCKAQRACNLYLRYCLMFRSTLTEKKKKSTVTILWGVWALCRIWLFYPLRKRWTTHLGGINAHIRGRLEGWFMTLLLWEVFRA